MWIAIQDITSRVIFVPYPEELTELKKKTLVGEVLDVIGVVGDYE
jgi:hypothetical protein